MKKHLSVWQAACIITGYGVGSGIMTLPYLVSRTGILWGLVLLAAAFFFAYVMHMMLAELTIGSGAGTQIVSVFSRFLFRGKAGKVLLGAFFVVSVLVMITNLAAYISGGSEVLAAFGMSPLAAKLVFYIVSAAIVFFGLKILGISESISVSVIIGIVLVLAAASLFHLKNPLVLIPGGVSQALAFFGMAMFSLVAIFSIPQAVEGLDGDPVKIRKAILLGLGLNCAFIIIILLCALASSNELTQLAMIGWSEGIGLWAKILGSVFTLLAMLTTYWSISLALSDVIEEQMKWNRRVCWLLATVPSLLLVVFDLGSFLELMRTAGGLIAILIAILVVPAYRRCRRECGRLLLSAPLGGTPVQILVVASFILMAVGSAVAI